MEVEVEVFLEETLTGARQLTSRAFLTFVTVDKAAATTCCRRFGWKPTKRRRAPPPLLKDEPSG